MVTVSGDKVEPKRNTTIQQMQYHSEILSSVAQLVSVIAAGKIRVVIAFVRTKMFAV